MRGDLERERDQAIIAREAERCAIRERLKLLAIRGRIVAETIRMHKECPQCPNSGADLRSSLARRLS